jgi:hypothetical protein
MGGKGSNQPQSDNQQLVNLQMQDSADAAAKETQRQARLAQGTQAIKSLFEGTPSGATPLDLSSLATMAAPTAANTQITPAMAQLYGQTGAPVAKGSLSNGYSWEQLPSDSSGMNYGLVDPSGAVVSTARTLADLSKTKIMTGGDPNNMTGGFGPDFYNKYRQSIMDYYMPQEGQQYNDARSNLTYSLARAGTLNSSIAGTDVGKLANQDAINRAQIASGADTQTAALRSQIQSDEETALNQLYSTEDPTLAANTASNLVANAQLTKPLLNPAGALFAPITAGVGNALTGFLNPAAYLNPGATGAGGATTPSGSQSSGQTRVG